MAPSSNLLVIADIAGTMRFLRMHAMSVVHAREIVVQLLVAVFEPTSVPCLIGARKPCAGFCNLRSAVE